MPKAIPTHPFDSQRCIGTVVEVSPDSVKANLPMAAAAEGRWLFGHKLGTGEVSEFVVRPIRDLRPGYERCSARKRPRQLRNQDWRAASSESHRNSPSPDDRFYQGTFGSTRDSSASTYREQGVRGASFVCSMGSGIVPNI
jgi:hypothetical protein